MFAEDHITLCLVAKVFFMSNIPEEKKKHQHVSWEAKLWKQLDRSNPGWIGGMGQNMHLPRFPKSQILWRVHSIFCLAGEQYWWLFHRSDRKSILFDQVYSEIKIFDQLRLTQGGWWARVRNGTKSDFTSDCKRLIYVERVGWRVQQGGVKKCRHVGSLSEV